MDVAACGRSFANRNQTPSCGRYTVDAFLSGHSPRELARFGAFRQHVEACGPVRLAPAKTRVGFQMRRIFAAVNALRPDRLGARLSGRGGWSTRGSIGSKRSRPRCYEHHIRIASPEELDGEVSAWLQESYAVGCPLHLGTGRVAR